MKSLLKQFVRPESRFLFPGVRHALKITSIFQRELVLEQAMEYVMHCKIPGDYLEFGVWNGRTFSAAFHLAKERNLGMRFWAFDSFAGLPEHEGVQFVKGEFACDEVNFERNLRRNKVDMSLVMMVKGWFNELRPMDHLRRAAIVWIDCDLYSSTVPVLKFITPYLEPGSLILFDDWNCFGADPHQGERKAAREWLNDHPELLLQPFLPFGWHGQSFVVQTACRAAEPDHITAGRGEDYDSR